MRNTILALVAVLLVAAGPAFAVGGEKCDWELGIYGGYGWLDDYGIFHPKDHLLYGARLGYFFSEHWNLEASAPAVPDRRRRRVDVWFVPEGAAEPK